MVGKTHLRAAFYWSGDADVELAQVLAAGLGMGLPVLAAAAIGHLPLGLAASLGSMAVEGVSFGPSATAQLRGLAQAAAPVALAAAGALAASRMNGWPETAAIVFLAGLAATIGGMSRALAIAAVRFVLFLLIIASTLREAQNAPGYLSLVAFGALWGSIVSLGLGALVRARRHADLETDADPAPVATPGQRYGRWKSSLAHLAGWQYTLRLVACLAVAGLLQSLWPARHLHWIAITIALLTQRQLERFPVKTTQRAIGTVLGVAGAGLLVAMRPPVFAVVIGIGLLAGLRPLLRARNYLTYSIVMTPLIILIMDVGAGVGGSVLIDRLVATLIGAALTIAANLAARKLLPTTVRAEGSHSTNA